jgi:hypothetical protein
MAPMSYLLSERHFRNNEDYLRIIVDTFPLLSVFVPPPTITQPDILARNIRYAARSLLTNQWPTSSINFAKFLQIWDDVSVSTTVHKGKVTCGPQEKLRELMAKNENPKQEVDVDEGPTQIVPKIRLIDPPLDLLQAVLTLHHYRYLTEPSEIQTTLNLEAFLANSKLDLAIDKSGDVYTVL